MGWMKNKAVAVVLLVVAVGVLGYVYKSQVAPEMVKFTLKAKDGTVCENVMLSATTQFPTECPKCKKSSKSAAPYWDSKANKVVFATDEDKLEPYMTPGDKAPVLPKK
jgi:Zn finger protein HypA/HybF involved in hydrogenase expression